MPALKICVHMANSSSQKISPRDQNGYRGTAKRCGCIKSGNAQVLAEIARLQDRLPVSEDDRLRGEAGFTLQRYLDNLSGYAETSRNLSDTGSDSGVHLETSENSPPSQDVASEDILYDTSLLE
jgi:hypothetical protein